MCESAESSCEHGITPQCGDEGLLKGVTERTNFGKKTGDQVEEAGALFHSGLPGGTRPNTRIWSLVGYQFELLVSIFRRVDFKKVVQWLYKLGQK